MCAGEKGDGCVDAVLLLPEINDVARKALLR